MNGAPTSGRSMFDVARVRARLAGASRSASLPLRTRHWDEEIAALDPVRDHVRILEILGNHVFPLDILVALELAQLRTFTIPSISAILHATGQYEREGQKRLDDTRAILTEIQRPGLDSRESEEMVAHLNAIHGAYAISNDDFLYTLSTFVFDPDVFVSRWGHRPLTEGEREAFFVFYRRLGERMHIRDIPPTRLGFLAWRRAYEDGHQRYDPANEHVARGMLRALGAHLPRPLGDAIEPLAATLLDDPRATDALGFRRAPGSVESAVRAALRYRRILERRLSLFEHAKFFESPFFLRYPTYPDGYERMRLGPAKVIAMMERKKARAER